MDNLAAGVQKWMSSGLCFLYSNPITHRLHDREAYGLFFLDVLNDRSTMILSVTAGDVHSRSYFG